jgi:hypothetical protein
MTKRQILASLNNIANLLDNLSLFQEANSITSIMTKIASDGWDDLKNINVNFPEETPTIKIPTKDNLSLDKLKQEYIAGVDNIISEFKYEFPGHQKKDIVVIKRHLKKYLKATDDEKLRKYQETERYHEKSHPDFFGLLLELFNFSEYFKNKYGINYLDMAKIIGPTII